MKRILLAAVLLSLAVAACDLVPWRGQGEPQSLVAMPANFIHRPIHTQKFTLLSHERVRTSGQVAAVYIDGDGVSWKAPRGRLPVPKTPVALKLAIKDVTANVIYLGRPCQFAKTENCSDEYLGSKRFSPEVIDAMNAALDDIKARYKVFGFNLTGYSGGGAIAALLAARRGDVLSLRTVAGTLDTVAFVNLHNGEALAGSLSPADVAARLLPVPQKHFIGANDTVVTSAVGEGFIRASGRPDCLALTSVDGATHETGWEEKWPELLEQPLEGGCQ